MKPPIACRAAKRGVRRSTRSVCPRRCARSPKRLPSNLFQFRPGTGEDRCVLDCITSLQNGADLLWIETEKPHIGQIGGMVSRIREVIPNAKLVYNNSPSFNWTLNFRQQVYDAMTEAGQDVSAYDRAKLMSVDYDGTESGLPNTADWTRWATMFVVPASIAATSLSTPSCMVEPSSAMVR